MSRIRRVFWICLVLVFAGGVSWWSSKTESGVVHHVRQEASGLVPLYKEHPELLQEYVADPVLEPILASTLKHVLAYANKHNNSVDVVVRTGDSSIYGDGSATHVVLFEVEDTVVGGLRIVCLSEKEPMVVAGVFPGAED